MGDFFGHPFHGNQWTDAQGGGGRSSAVVQKDDYKLGAEPASSDEGVRNSDGTLKDEGNGAPPPEVGVPFVVYRLGHSTTTELRKNAANAEGLADHLVGVADKLEKYDVPYGDTVTAFRVVLTEPTHGDYKPQGGGGPAPAPGSLPGTGVGRKVKWDDADGKSVWYSFDSGYKATKIGSVPLQQIGEALKEHDRRGGLFSVSMAGTLASSKVIRAAFKK